MTLTAADVAQIMRVLEQTTFDELTLEIDGVKLVLRRTGAAGAPARSATSPGDPAPTAPFARPDAAIAVAPGTGAPPAAEAAGAEPAKAGSASPHGARPNLGEITSPMLGTFYRAPKPGSAPFVEIGSTVDADSVIAIIEVMKLMNTVRAGVRGVIAEILPADESLVEFGDVLMRVRTET